MEKSQFLRVFDQLRRGRTRFWIITVLLLGGLAWGAWRLQACAPSIDQVVLAPERHPDLPLKPYAAGRLGVLQPSFARSYLVVAYRYLSDRPLGPEEQATLLQYWQERMPSPHGSDPANWPEEWREVRKQETGEQGPEITIESPDGLAWYIRIPGGAFGSAAETLHARAAMHGKANPWVLAWVEAQDLVFQSTRRAPRIPTPLPGTAPLWARQDRDYQIAAAHFYAEDFDETVRRMDLIAGEPDHPWAETARTVATRAVLRKAMLKGEAREAAMPELDRRLGPNPFTPARKEGQPTSEPGEEEEAWHYRARAWYLARAFPEQRVVDLARKLLNPGPPHEFYRDLQDYTFLLDRFLDDDCGVSWTSWRLDRKGLKPPPPRIREAELTDWILCLQRNSDTEKRHALDRWKGSQAPVWLVAALMKAEASDPEASELIQAAQTLSPSHPGYAHALIHAGRLLHLQGRQEEARNLMDGFLKRRNLEIGVRNQALTMRMAASRNLPDFLRHSARAASGLCDTITFQPPDFDEKTGDFHYPKPGRSVPKVFWDPAGVAVLNEQLPVNELLKALRAKALPASLQGQLERVVFTRALLLGRLDAVQQVAPALLARFPQADVLKEPGTQEDLRGKALLVLLRHPGFIPQARPGWTRETPVERIDSYRDNWWLPIPSETNAWNYSSKGRVEEIQTGLGRLKLTPAWVTEAFRQQATSEGVRLHALPAAPTWLCRATADFAQAHPQHPLVPEMLHLAVKSSRFGIGDEATGPQSRRCFQLLHQGHPSSPWTSKTPHWFS